MRDQASEQPGRSADPLAGSIMYDLIDAHPNSMTTAEVGAKVERTPEDRPEVEAALAVLVRDGLATQDGENWTATIACVRANELAF
jgi:hypothetical protein